MTTDWLPELVDDDLDVLLEALEAWEHKDVAGEVIGEMVGAIVADRSNPAARLAYEQQARQHRAEAEADTRLRKDRSVLLRAKLITIRDRRRGDRMTQEALRRP